MLLLKYVILKCLNLVTVQILKNKQNTVVNIKISNNLRICFCNNFS